MKALIPDPAVLHGMELFAGLEASALAEVVREAHVRRVRKGTRIFAQSDSADTCHALIHGRVKIVQQGADGQQLVVRFVGPGETFGTAAVVVGTGYPGDALAVEDCVEVTWRQPVMAALMERHPAIAMNALRIVGRRLREVQTRLREVSTERVERRVAHAILRLVRQAGRRMEDGGVEIAFALSRQDLAEMTGTTLHTVSRIVAAWDAGGIVESGRQHLVIRKPHHLVALAEDLPPPGAATDPTADSAGEVESNRPLRKRKDRRAPSG